MRGEGVVRGGKRTLLVSNEKMNYIIKTIKSIEDLDVLIDGATEARKNDMKKQEGGALLAPLVASVVQPLISSVIKGITEIGVMRARKEYYNNMNKTIL